MKAEANRTPKIIVLVLESTTWRKTNTQYALTGFKESIYHFCSNDSQFLLCGI